MRQHDESDLAVHVTLYTMNVGSRTIIIDYFSGASHF
jgi:hypothetical protein